MTKPFSARELLARVGSLIAVARVRREAETAIRHSEERLREADRRKDEFLATLAHELRNPLAPIRSAVALLRADAGDSNPLHAVLERQVVHMVRLIDDLMDASRISSGKIELRREPVLLADIVQAAVEAARPAVEAAHHRLTVELPAEPITLMADAVRLTQVVGNILNNAIKYTEHGGGIAITAASVPAGSLTLKVRDSGIGIPPEMIGRVFDMFTQVDSSRGRAQGGLGIGLSLARSLVEMHGGTIEAHSDGPGRGTEVSLRLPVASEARPAESGAVPAAASRSSLRTRVLVVDDSRDSADMLVALLTQMGAEATAVYDGTSALAIVADLKPSLVFLDLGMPSLDGYQVATEMRRREELSAVRVVALSGWGQEQDRRRTAAAGFDAHLVKPVDVGALRHVLAGTRNGQR